VVSLFVYFVLNQDEQWIPVCDAERNENYGLSVTHHVFYFTMATWQGVAGIITIIVLTNITSYTYEQRIIYFLQLIPSAILVFIGIVYSIVQFVRCLPTCCKGCSEDIKHSIDSAKTSKDYDTVVEVESV